MKTIAIDGACRRNGSPDCVSAGACFILIEEAIEQSFISTSYETESTSQRGELCGLLLALENTVNNPTDTVIVTDSEYIFNTITKEWVARWRSTGWLTAEGTPVKNQDLWDQIWLLYTQVKDYVTIKKRNHKPEGGSVNQFKIAKENHSKICRGKTKGAF